LFFILLINLQKNKTNKLFPCHKQTLKNIFQLETSFKLNKFRSFPFISNIKDKSKSNTTQNLSQQKTSCRSSLKTLDDETNEVFPNTHPSFLQLHAAQSHQQSKTYIPAESSILSKSTAYLDLCLIFLRFLFNLLIRFFFHWKEQKQQNS